MNIINIISPLIVTIMLGYLVAKQNYLNKQHLEGLSKLTFSIIIPIFLFQKMASANISEHIASSHFGAFYFPLLTIYGITCLLHYHFHHKAQSTNKKNIKSAAVFSLASSYSNTVIVGLPVLLAAIGEQVIGLVFLIITFHSALLFTLTSFLAAMQTNTGQKGGGFSQINWQQLIKQTLNNPLVLSITLGLLVNISPLNLPVIVEQSLVLLGKPAITLALFLLGASLTYYKIKPQRRFITLAVVIKLITFPALVWLCADKVFALNQQVTMILVILSASPTGVNAYLIAKNEQSQQATTASIVVMTTCLSVITIPFWLWWLS